MAGVQGSNLVTQTEARPW